MARRRDGLHWMAMLGLLVGTAALAQSPSIRLAPRTTLAWTIASSDYLTMSMSGEGEIDADGNFDVGPYGSMKLAGMTLENACAAIEQTLRQHIAGPRVSLQITSAPPIRLESVPLAPRQATAPFAQRQPAAQIPASPLAPRAAASPLAPARAPVYQPPAAPARAPVYQTPAAPRTQGQTVTAPVQSPPALPVYRQPIVMPPPDMQPVQATEIIMVDPQQEIHVVDPPAWPDADLSGAMSVESRWRPMSRAVPVPTTMMVMQAQAGADQPPAELNVFPRKLHPEAVPATVIVGHAPPAPRENAMTTLPPYVIAPPDILMVESTQQLRDQPIRGQHLVRPDGTIGLGIYGSVYVAGMTLDDARQAIAEQVGKRVKDVDPRNIAVDVLAYNSKFYYVITDGGGYGEQVTRLPITGNETVLDAIGQINGLPAVASKKNIWVARAHAGHEQVLPVDWNSIAQRGSTVTNYQIMPGDRVYVRAQKIIRADSALAKVLSPFERILGITLLGSTTVNQIQGRGNGFGQ